MNTDFIEKLQVIGLDNTTTGTNFASRKCITRSNLKHVKPYNGEYPMSYTPCETSLLRIEGMNPNTQYITSQGLVKDRCFFGRLITLLTKVTGCTFLNEFFKYYFFNSDLAQTSNAIKQMIQKNLQDTTSTLSLEQKKALHTKAVHTFNQIVRHAKRPSSLEIALEETPPAPPTVQPDGALPEIPPTPAASTILDTTDTTQVREEEAPVVPKVPVKAASSTIFNLELPAVYDDHALLDTEDPQEENNIPPDSPESLLVAAKTQKESSSDESSSESDEIEQPAARRPASAAIHTPPQNRHANSQPTYPYLKERGDSVKRFVLPPPRRSENPLPAKKTGDERPLLRRPTWTKKAPETPLSPTRQQPDRLKKRKRPVNPNDDE
jgi:hypothetical protein